MDVGTYRCAVCGKVHQGPALSYGFAALLAYDRVPRWLRWYRRHLTTDTCLPHRRRHPFCPWQYTHANSRHRLLIRVDGLGLSQ
jgi:hypothetical protein